MVSPVQHPAGPEGLVEAFDRIARAQEVPAGADLLAAVAADDDAPFTLLDEFAEICLTDDRVVAQRYGRHLAALAEHLDDEVARLVRAVVEVELAALAVRTGDLAEARLRIERCAAEDAEMLPGLAGDRERVSAVLAEADGRIDDARRHAARARDFFTEDESWADAALAAEVTAGLHPAVTVVALADWRHAAELYIRADDPDEARGCVTQACSRLLGDLGTMNDHRTMSELCEAARKLAVDYDHAEAAARVGLALTTLAGDTGLSWDDLQRMHRRTRRELEQTPPADPAQRLAEFAQVDFSLGRAAMVRGRRNDARHHLTEALNGMRAADVEEGVQLCLTMLRPLGGPDAGFDDPPPTGDITDPDLKAVVLLTDAAQLVQQGRIDDARAHLAEANSLASTATPDRALMVDAITVAIARAAGDEHPTQEVLARLNDFLTAEGDRLPPSSRSVLTTLAQLLDAGADPTDPGAAPDRQDLATALGDLRGHPKDPVAGPRAASLIERFLASDPMGHIAAWRELSGLLTIADSAPPSMPSWRRTRAIAQVCILAGALAEGERADFDAADAELARIERAADDPTLAPVFESARLAIRMGRSIQQGDEAGQARLPEDLGGFLDGFSDAARATPHGRLLGDLVEMLAARARGDDTAAATARLAAAADQLSATGAGAELADRIRLALGFNGDLADGTAQRPTDGVLADLQRLADRPGLGAAERALLLSSVAMAALGDGRETDLGRVDLAIDRLRQAVDLLGPYQQQVLYLGCLAVALSRRHELTNSSDDLREARTILTRARILAGGPAHPQWAMLTSHAADIGWLLGDDPELIELILDGLRTHMWQVLAQTNLKSATLAARGAASAAVEAARSCLVAHHPAAAIAALDAGRGLALYAATEFHTIGDRLVAAGLNDLARRWRMSVADSADGSVPSNLPREILTALHEHTAIADLLDPPDFAAIQQALTVLDADALVYLVPGTAAVTGFAVAAPSSGPPSFLTLPNLTIDGRPEIERFLRTLSRRDLAPAAGRDMAPLDKGDGDTALARQLDELCRWAWGAAMGPLIESWLPTSSAPTHREPRIVLVPMGDLARIPWQAARRPADGVRAIELVAISQAASARMLCRSAALAPVPLGASGLLVGDPDTNGRAAHLTGARREAFAIRQCLYPGARYVGRRPDGTISLSGPGTAAEVRSWLTAAGPVAGSLLHLACHGFVDAGGDRPTAYLALAGGEQLTAAELSALLARSTDRAIGLVVLAACRTGLSMMGYDEAYSLGTAFLAGGVRSVLCTQWSVPDDATSVLMFMFHHYLRKGGRPVWAALRDAQLWMLRRDREVPRDMPPALRRLAESHGRDGVIGWAAFVHWGQ